MLSRTTHRVSLSGGLICEKVFKRAHHCEPASPLFDWRRRRDRSNWCPFDRETIENMSLEGVDYHGLNVELNWALAFESVHPHYLAFRNLHSRGLAMYFQGTKDKNHALHTTIQSKPVSTFLKLPTKEELEADLKVEEKRRLDLIEASDDYQINVNGVTKEQINEFRKNYQETELDEGDAERAPRPQEEQSIVLPEWLALPKNDALVTPQVASFSRDLRIHLSSYQDKLFVHDGVFGSDPRTELRVRLITNCPNMALTYSNLVINTSPQDAPLQYRPRLVIYHSADFLDDHPVSQYGVEGDKDLCLIDWLKGTVFLGGHSVVDAQVLRSLLAKASFHFFPNRSIVPLPAFVHSTSDASQPTLIFHNSESPLLTNVFNEQNNKNVFGNQYVSWSDYGLSSLFSDPSTQSTQRGDLVQHIVKNNKEERVNHVPRRKAVPAVIPHPKKIVLVSNSSNSSSTSSLDLITEHLNQNFSSFPVDVTKWAEAINQKIEKHQVKVEKVALKSESAADLKKALSSVLA